MINSYKFSVILCAIIIISSCSSVKVFSKYELSDGAYWFKQKGEKAQKVTISIADDSIQIKNSNNNIVATSLNHDQIFSENSLDVDIFIAPFKYRPSVSNFPRQLTTSFNANLFTGFRIDRFRVHKQKKFTGGYKTVVIHRSTGIGLFGGLGTTAVGPWNTNYKTNDEYSGLVISHGAILLIGVNSLTMGLAIGYDRLTDRDKDIWIYQNEPWYGLTIGINIR
jgi:hypothetical protein